MQSYQIYLCGGMAKFGKKRFEESNKWREFCKVRLQNYYKDNYRVRVINPNDYFSFKDEPPQYNTQREAMRFDLYMLRRSDLVIINFNDPYSLGSMAELAIAYDRGIPIIGLQEHKQELHPWQICMCERVFGNIMEMVDYVEDFYL